MRIIVLALFLAALAVAVPYAVQTPAQNLNIPFDFVVGNKSYPAGEYEVNHANMDVPAVTLRSGKTVIDAIVITWLARPETDLTMVKLVFDKVGDKRILSEVWMPGQEGLLIHAQKGKHEHEIVTGQ